MKRMILTLCMLCIPLFYSFSQNGWVQVADYPGNGSVGMTGYNFLSTGLVGFGYYYSNTNNFADVWEYDPITDTWTQRANFPGTTRYGQSGFSLGKKAYICLGSDAYSYFNDMWEYDGGTNTWTQKANFMGSGRYGAIAQGGGGNKAYAGLGEHDNGNGYVDYCADFYQYDWSTNVWTQKANFPGVPRFGAFSFLAGNKVYVLCGRTETPPYSAWIYLHDMYAYDIATNTWTQKTSFPGQGSIGLGGFVLGDYAYVGTGYANFAHYSDFWKYDPLTDTWLQLADFPDGIRSAVMSFNIGTYGFLGCGNTGSNYHQDMWRYQDPTIGIREEQAEGHIKLYPQPACDIIYIEGNGMQYIDIFNADGSLVKHSDVCGEQNKISVDISGLAAGFYYAGISCEAGAAMRKIIKN